MNKINELLCVIESVSKKDLDEADWGDLLEVENYLELLTPMVSKEIRERIG
ncbi:hypothetical protein BIZ89_gp165 [Bacillus phage Kida]|uniref:hypothetical protein n=1 Tax=Bacillus phage Kida TaxID=1873998 RepID=UPI0008110F34|nr:hypothetical protein BIZ89_gp165 [Bacillus phage Kida]ANU79792.1 hypothetical protein KIDA_165 [Bacillus phage Kida]